MLKDGWCGSPTALQCYSSSSSGTASQPTVSFKSTPSNQDVPSLICICTSSSQSLHCTADVSPTTELENRLQPAVKKDVVFRVGEGTACRDKPQSVSRLELKDFHGVFSGVEG